MQFMELRLKDKQKEQKIAWMIAKRVFAYFDWKYVKAESTIFMKEKIEELLTSQDFSAEDDPKPAETVAQPDELSQQVSDILGLP